MIEVYFRGKIVFNNEWIFGAYKIIGNIYNDTELLKEGTIDGGADE